MRETEDIRLNPVAAGKGKPHNRTIEGRQRISMTGVIDVESFNEQEILVRSEAGMLTVFGQGLHISKLDLDAETLWVDGFVEGLEYHEQPQKQGGVFSKLFR